LPTVVNQLDDQSLNDEDIWLVNETSVTRPLATDPFFYHSPIFPPDMQLNSTNVADVHNAFSSYNALELPENHSPLIIHADTNAKVSYLDQSPVDVLDNYLSSDDVWVKKQTEGNQLRNQFFNSQRKGFFNGVKELWGSMK
jgi:hypothetical protein